MKKSVIAVAALLAVTLLASCSSGGTASSEGESLPSPRESLSVDTFSEELSTTPTPTPTPAPTPTPTPTPTLPSDPAEVLKGKTALFCGDSIVMASTYDKDHQWWGWAGRIYEQYGLKTYRNAGVDGATVSNYRSDNMVVKQVKNNRSVKYDFVVLEGGVNDAWEKVELGTMTETAPEDTKVEDLDLSTFAGGLEDLLYHAKLYYPDSTICYVICYRMYSAGIASLRDMSAYVEMTKKICDKWGIPYLNLYGDKAFDKEFESDTNRNLPDHIHPNSRGYDILTKYVAQAMADFYDEKQ